ncbi:MFS transporter [Candidatus Pacearchaeota archaeon]|jgi:hypothetical protein|nr:MFS transporter [Candidatus Pacearchaeota archaeon]
MKLKNSKNKIEKSVGIFEIFLMVLSILTFSYLIGEEIGLVSGGDIDASTIVTAGSTLVAPKAIEKISGYFAETETSIYSRYGGYPLGTGPAPADAGLVTTPTTGVGARALTIAKGLASTAVTALVLYFVIKWVSGLIPGVSSENAAGLGLWGAVGYGIGGTVGVIASQFGALGALSANLLPSLSFLSVTPIGLIAAGVAILAYILFAWKDYRAYLVTFNCLTWQPQSGGQYCEQCNEPLFGTGEIRCSKYRCESLGSGCKIVDVGEEEEMCYWEDKNDVTAPEIVAWDEALSEGFIYNPNIALNQYIDGGVTIEYEGSEDGCIPPYQTFSFGISLNKIGYCKVDTNKTASYEDMTTPISGGYASYNHTITMNLEGSINEDGDLELQNEDIELYVKCESTGGYSNDKAFVFKYCVQDELDTTAPIIMNTEPATDSPIKQGTTEQAVKIYVDKPSTCKWSYSDESYDAMQNTMSGSGSVGRYGYYEYTTTLSGLKDLTENEFYFNCKSYPALEGTEKESQRTVMTENYLYTLIGTKGLIIDSVSPDNETIKDSTDNVKVTVSAKTSQGYNDGESYCSIRESTATSSVPFFSDVEPTYQHTQDLYLIDGDYTYEIVCCDIGGNCDTETIEFSVETDIEAPMIVRAYNEGNSLKLITNEKAECVYDTVSCSYTLENGIAISSSDNIEHTLDWDTGNTFFIKCKDEFDGEPAGDECTIIVRPSDSF